MMKNFLLFLFLFFSVFSFSQERILIEGSVVDESDFEIPYAAVGIIKKPRNNEHK